MSAHKFTSRQFRARKSASLCWVRTRNTPILTTPCGNGLSCRSGSSVLRIGQPRAGGDYLYATPSARREWKCCIGGRFFRQCRRNYGRRPSACFRQALALAEAIEARDLQLYERAHRKLALRAARMGKLILMLAGNNLLRERAIRCMAARPEVFEKLLAIHTGDATPGQAVSTSLLLAWQFLAT